jgi:ribulokinase
VGLFDSMGNLYSLASCAYPTEFPQAGWAEQKPNEWWSALVKATRDCLRGTLIDIEEIRGLCVDATTCTLVALNEDLDPIRPALLWMDVRSADQANRIFDTGHEVFRYSLAGCNAEWMPSKALWLAENERQNYDRMAYLVEYTDWLNHRLTGRLALNLNTITQRWYYHSRRGGWSEDFFSRIGLAGIVEKFPSEIISPGGEIGHLKPSVAKLLGLPDAVMVFQGGGGAFIGLLGLNVAQPGKVGLITGSSNVLGGFVDGEFHVEGLYGAFPDAVIPGLWLVEGGQVSTGSILSWYNRNFANDLPKEKAYEILNSEAANVPPGSDGVIVLDYFQGNRTPHTDSKARGAIWGLSLHTTRGQVFRALMEGVAFGTRRVLDEMARYGHHPREIFACGGATRSDLFMQIYADICGVPLSVTQIPDAPLLGDAILAFTGLGIYPDFSTAAGCMVKIGRTYQPDVEHKQEYDFFYDLYARTYHQLRDLMHECADHREIG